MTISAHKTIASVRGALPSDLLKPGYIHALHVLERTLGKSCSSFYFEWHLADPHRIDLLYSVVRENGSDLRETIAKNPVLSTEPQWGVLQRFLDKWDNVYDRLDGILPHLWLASDFDVATKEFNPPNIHFCIDPNFTRRDELPGYRNELTERQFSGAVRAIADASLSSLPASVVRSLYKCFRALSVDGEVVHLSFMHGRTPPVFKLNCTLPADAVAGILRGAGRSVDPSPVIDLIDEFAPDEKRIKCNLRVDTGICDCFELELEYNTPLKSDPRRRRMFASLSARGLVTQEQLQGLRKWPGTTIVPSGKNSSTLHLERWLDVKLVIDDQSRLAAKAYLGFAPVPALGW